MVESSPDQAALAAAIAACARALAALDDASLRSERARLAAVEEWLGPHRREFDERTARWRGVADDARASLVATQHVLRATADESTSYLRRGLF